MSYQNGRSFTDFRGINLQASNGLVRFNVPDVTPTTTSGEYVLYVNSGGSLVFNNGSADVVLGAAGGAATTWEAIYTNDSTFALTATWTITQGGNVAILTLNKTANGAGAVIDITNSGTGKDLKNGSAWSIVASSGVGVLELGSTGSINVTDGALTIGKTGTATTFGGTVTITEASTFTGAVTATASVTITGTADSNCLTVTAGDVVVSNGKLALTNDDTDTAVAVTANSVTGGSVISVTANGVTSGDMILLTTTDSGFSGAYLRITDGSDVFTIGDEGATTIVGSAVGSSVLTLSAGDLTISDGNVAVTSSSTSDVFSITDNSLLANNALIVKGSGAFTGTTSSSFVAITPTGLSTGTALYIAGAAATTLSTLVDVTSSTTTGIVLRLVASGTQTGVGQVLAMSSAGTTTTTGLVSLTANSLTTGIGLNLTSTSTGWTSGNFINIALTSSGTLAARTGAAIAVASSMTHTADTDVTQAFNSHTITRTVIRNTGGADTHATTSSGALLALSNVITATTGTITDTVAGLTVSMSASGTGTGVEITHAGTTGGKSLDIIASATTATVALLTAASLTTTGVGLSIVGAGTGLTSGSLLRVSTGTTATVATNGVVSIRATGAYLSTANVGLLDVVASGLTGAGTVARFAATAASQTASEVVRVQASGYTTGYSGVVMNVIGCATTGAASTTHSVLTVTGANTTGGNMVQLSNDALTTGVGFLFAHATSVIADTGSMLRLTSSSIDTGGATNATILDIKATASTAGVLAWIADTALTTGIALKVSGTAAYTGTGFIALSAATTTGVSVLLTNSALTTGTGLSVVNSSSNTGAWKGISSSITNTAAVAAAPFRASNVAVNNSKFTRMFEGTDGTKTVTIWLSQDATTPNGTLSGTAGDICLNGPSNRSFYCTGTTNWTASNA